jgi:hypothetical protein
MMCRMCVVSCNIGSSFSSLDNGLQPSPRRRIFFSYCEDNITDRCSKLPLYLTRAEPDPMSDLPHPLLPPALLNTNLFIREEPSSFLPPQRPPRAECYVGGLAAAAGGQRRGQLVVPALGVLAPLAQGSTSCPAGGRR